MENMLLVAETIPNKNCLYLKIIFLYSFQISEKFSSLAFSPSRIGTGKEKVEGKKQTVERASNSSATITIVIRSHWGHVKPL